MARLVFQNSFQQHLTRFTLVCGKKSTRPILSFFSEVVNFSPNQVFLVYFSRKNFKTPETLKISHSGKFSGAKLFLAAFNSHMKNKRSFLANSDFFFRVRHFLTQNELFFLSISDENTSKHLKEQKHTKKGHVGSFAVQNCLGMHLTCSHSFVETKSFRTNSEPFF